jgi:TonB-dependent SusC/RagA subfamily outer membrane receptor
MNSGFIYRVFLVSLCFVCLSQSLFAQERIIYGVVNMYDSIPLIGAEVFVKSNKQTVFTDSEGKFTIFTNAKDRVKITARGFSSQKVKITPKVKIVAVNLRPKPGAGGEELVYDIGYGRVLEKDRTTSTTSMPKNEASFSRYMTIWDMISGQFPGVEVRNQQVIIRGNTSFNSSSAALLVLDGVIVESNMINNIRPIEVKNISVIKDGSAAVYGSRGANGVVLIETRKGGDELR